MLVLLSEYLVEETKPGACQAIGLTASGRNFYVSGIQDMTI